MTEFKLFARAAVPVFALFAALSLVASCSKPAESTTRVGSFDVELLFTHDGCSVFRFFDGINYHFYADCRGGTSSTVKEGRSERIEEIPTIGREQK